MPVLLRVAALGVFIVGVAIGVIDDTPDAIDMLSAALLGLAFWVGSTLVPER